MSFTQSALRPLVSTPQADNPDRPFVVYTARDLERIVPLARLSAAQRFDMRVVSTVLPFRVNQYVIDELIDWEAVPNDPIFQLVFPQRGMLEKAHFDEIAALLQRNADKSEIDQAVGRIREALNPHPADQMLHNMPRDDDDNRIDGLQHKYR